MDVDLIAFWRIVDVLGRTTSHERHVDVILLDPDTGRLQGNEVAFWRELCPTFMESWSMVTGSLGKRE